VESGGLYVLNGLAVVAKGKAAAGEAFVGIRTGVVELPKDGAASATEGAIAYWSVGDSHLTATATGNKKVGVFPYGAVGGSDSADVLLTGQIVE
jgi:predicted RecA/RadA family phage recombinase